MAGCVIVAAVVSSALFAETAQAQKLSGTLYSDYSYDIQTESGEDEGENGFGLRRLYLTGDYDISDDFSVKARLEANDGSTTEQGRIAPFVKDLSLKAKNVLGAGHDVEVGITSPPSFKVSEKVWGYRSIEKTIQDRIKVVSSRDVGVVARGPLTSSGSVKYGLMVANNSGGKPETNKAKRVYAQLEFYPAEGVSITVGGDYAGSSEEDEDGTINTNAFIGYSTGDVTVGVEGLLNQVNAVTGADFETMAASVFVRASVSETVEVIGRVDRVNFERGAASSWSNYAIAGVAVKPHPKVRFIPNVMIGKDEFDDQAYVTGRLTLHADF